jgi:membrane dipeptidase
LHAIDRQAEQGVRVIRTVADIRAAKDAGEAGIIIGFQNSDPFEGHLPYVELFHRLGLRICQLTYQRRNLAGDGTGEPANAGLSLYGRELVGELNRLGILIDLSHTGTAGCLEIVELSTAPVAVTHSCLKSLNDVSRNTDEEVAKAVARRGGVFGVNAIARLLSPKGRQQGATIEQYVDVVDHLVDLLGVDHVGIGLDINEGLTPELFAERQKGFLSDFPELRMGGDFPFEHYYVFGLTSISKVRGITAELVRRSYSDEDVMKILGGNFFRLFEQVWSS